MKTLKKHLKTSTQMNEEEIIKFLRKNVEPLKEKFFGEGYRASVYLADGTFLPCVIFRNSKEIIELAKRRFDEERKGHGPMRLFPGGGYNEIIKTFVAHGNRINIYDISKVELSRYAFPISVIEQIHGETTMAWTAFVAKMKDGKYIGFGTSSIVEFFQMPKEYSVNDIEKIINHSFVLPNGELRSLKQGFCEVPKDYENAVTYRERPFFECFIDNL